jgi:hypothetical protein
MGVGLQPDTGILRRGAAHSPVISHRAAMLDADAGDAARIDTLVKAAQEKGKGYGHFHHTAYTIARAYALLGRASDAVTWLRRTADDGFPCYPVFANDPSLNRIHGDGLFQDFMAQQKPLWEGFTTRASAFRPCWTAERCFISQRTMMDPGLGSTRWTWSAVFPVASARVSRSTRRLRRVRRVDAWSRPFRARRPACGECRLQTVSSTNLAPLESRSHHTRPVAAHGARVHHLSRPESRN